MNSNIRGNDQIRKAPAVSHVIRPRARNAIATEALNGSGRTKVRRDQKNEEHLNMTSFNVGAAGIAG